MSPSQYISHILKRGAKLAGSTTYNPENTVTFLKSA